MTNFILISKVNIEWLTRSMTKRSAHVKKQKRRGGSRGGEERHNANLHRSSVDNGRIRVHKTLHVHRKSKHRRLQTDSCGIPTARMQEQPTKLLPTRHQMVNETRRVYNIRRG